MAALEIQQIAGTTYMIPAPANIGIYEQDGRVIVIDSGNDKEAGRQILKLLNARGWTLELIINTHSNGDHIGGNAFLQQKTNCRIAATSLEAAFIQHPVLEPAFLFGGFPMNALRNKFLMAAPSTITDVIPNSGGILHTGLEAISIPGHFFDMIAIRTPDNVVFLADCLFPDVILQKYHIFFLYDVQAHFATLDQLQTLQAAYYAPGHGELSTEIAPLIERNRRQVQEILDALSACCAHAVSFDEILAQVCQRYDIALNPNQYVLIGSTLRSCLAYLVDKGIIELDFSTHGARWFRR
ncbi:metal-dependent hydrolase, beta-lactamase superfamily [Candidatus Moduliflexus flocculans]|uniref:Metal-dependent hydrolase, beta-lactamase superfamily n=1 Tax=Candidatus Moduliflexus flocculans TaxID=1499966 RepID=A0A0S6VWC1_9BACT|nr:metal-dependent hydrolase, beta-lactamase superfamily [Candidatus Moduliflexus flocculans]